MESLFVNSRRTLSLWEAYPSSNNKELLQTHKPRTKDAYFGSTFKISSSE
jgi:hypothetical protein